MTHATFSDIDSKSVSTVRVLAADVVQKANSGHPGAPMGCAPMSHVLFSKFIKNSSAHPKWINRDRFVLSNGHGCALLYILLHLNGFNVSMDDLKAFRQLNSKTPGHPEANHGVNGIEVTTGPLGQGISSAVGLAIAQTHLGAYFNKPGFELINNHTYVIVGDGCLQEGVASEACSLAGHLQLGNLIVLYDDNHITIDGDTDVSFTEDVLKRFEAYGWHTQTLGDGDHDLESIAHAVEIAKSVTDRPSIIKIRTTIGFGSKSQGEEKVHGAPLGAEDIKGVKAKFGFDPSESFVVSQEVYDFWKSVQSGAEQEVAKWDALFASYRQAFPELAGELERRIAGKWIDVSAVVPRYTPADPAIATRKLSENVLNAIAEKIPELVGGSADLTGSNLTRWKTAVDYQPDSTKLGTYAGRYFRFGVREHGMAAILNGLHAYGALVPFGATFLNFISYALGAVRLSALSKHQVIYIMTHDSIGLGEDGPTHQPIETLAELRALPNLNVYRPADGNETAGSYLAALSTTTTPSVFCLTRQNLPQLAGSSPEAVLKGGYVLQDAENPSIVLAATGSEVSLAVDTAKELANSGIHARVVSMPCIELFDAQDLEYKKSVFPEGVPVMSIEVMSTVGWHKYAHAPVGIETFGKSAPAPQIYKYFGFVPNQLAEKAKKVVAFYKTQKPEWKVISPF
ncbi:Transketolase, thiamine diphosphate binding domain-containing protein [Cladochytrium replicatum]|nr:Transketolase, thiamine diphosphate binding domain-containing protein [Cladochytrium replicatum]